MSRGKKGRKLLKPPRSKNAKRKHKKESEVDQLFKQEKYVSKIVDLQKQGFSAGYIKSTIAETNNDKLSTNSINYYYQEANRFLSAEYANRTLGTKAIHVARYNRNISELLQTKELSTAGIGVEYRLEDWMESRKRKIEKFDDCIDTLFQKEKCLQMHSKNFVININEEVNINVNTAKHKKPDLNKLDFDEMVELMELVVKQKKGEEEPLSVSEAIEDTLETIDGVAEVISTKINVDDIKHDAPPVKPVTGEPVFNATGKLRNALAKLAQEKLNKDNPGTGSVLIDTVK